MASYSAARNDGELTIHGMMLIPVFVLLLLFLFSADGSARIVDAKSAPDPILDLLEHELDVRGIDIRRGSATGQDRVGTRPQLTHLQNLPVEGTPIDSEPYNFEKYFRSGAFTESVLVAVGKAPEPAALDAEKFKQVWEAASQESRLFISFSGKDLNYALHVSEALQAQGYATFLYKNELGKLGFNAVDVGRFFSEAGGHLVIDTPEARRSVAVGAEARALLSMRQARTRPNPLKPNPVQRRSFEDLFGPNRSQFGENHCCKRCTKRGGIVINCGPVECGPQCAIAEKNPFDTLMGR
jgi:hypothetical protein